MLERYKEKQFLFYNYITRSLANDKISHAYLVESNGVSYAFELCKDFAKFLLCNGVNDERIIEQINNEIYSNLIVIDADNVIKKEEIISLQANFSLKSTDDKKRVYLIKNAEMLTDSSANSLLKFLEEPEQNIIAILLVNNVNNVKETILSRCQIISLVNNEKFNYESIFDYYDAVNNEDKRSFIKNEFDKYINFYCNLEKNKQLVLKDKDIYELSNNIVSLLKFGLYLYFDLISVILEIDKEEYFPKDDRKAVILSYNSVDTLLKKIEIINRFLVLSRFNVNKNLFLDNFIIKFGG